MARARKSTIDALLDDFEALEIDQQRDVADKIAWLMGRSERAAAKAERKNGKPAESASEAPERLDLREPKLATESEIAEAMGDKNYA